MWGSALPLGRPRLGQKALDERCLADASFACNQGDPPLTCDNLRKRRIEHSKLAVAFEQGSGQTITALYEMAGARVLLGSAWWT